MFDEMFPPIETDDRGCGQRKDQALYACCGLAPPGSMGSPVESFIIDPPILWDQGAFRGVQFVERDGGPPDLLLWVGAENYPTVPDFVEEGRRMGFCKRIPTGDLKDDGTFAKGNNNYGEVVPYVSRMILVHPRAVIDDSYQVQLQEMGDGSVPHITRHAGACDQAGNIHHIEHGIGEPCTFATWDLSATKAWPGHDIVSSVETVTRIQTPSCDYQVRTPIEVGGQAFDPQGEDTAPVAYSPGVFLTLPLSHFEYVNQDGSVDLPEPVADLLGNNRNAVAVKEK